MSLLKFLGIGIASLCLLFVLHQGVDALVKAHNWKGLGASDWAAWVQAVGSVAAIIAGFVVANRQSKAASQLAHLDHVESGNERLDAILTLATLASDALDGEMAKIGTQEPVNMYQKDAADLGNASRALAAIPVPELGSAEMIRGVNKLQHCIAEFTRMRMNGSNPTYFLAYDRAEWKAGIEAILADKNVALAAITTEVELGRQRLSKHGLQ